MTESTENLPDVLSVAVSAIHDRHQPATNNVNTNNTQNNNNVQWRNLISFWILGMCNNYGYVVMLSAAHDIIERFSGYSVKIFILIASITFLY